MCTALTYNTKDFYFGRTLDYEFSYGEEITITPRNYEFNFRHMGKLSSHYAIIGMAYVVDEYSLYYDAINEKGLGMAGLNFVGNAVYQDCEVNRECVAQFEFIPWILSKCGSVKEAKELISKMNLVKTPYSEQLPASQLHWIIADKNEAITVECMEDGLHVLENEVGVLTNNPPFNMQLFNLNNYMALSTKQPKNNFSSNINLNTYSRGMGAIGLPGDLSSMSRFVRCAYTKLNSVSKEDESSSVNQYFHIIGSVEQQRGCCEVADNKYEISIYTSCCNATKGIYYYRTYENQQVSAVDMNKENLDSKELIRYPLKKDEEIYWHN